MQLVSIIFEDCLHKHLSKYIETIDIANIRFVNVCLICTLKEI